MTRPADMRTVQVRRVQRLEPGVASAEPPRAPWSDAKKRPAFEVSVRQFLESKKRRCSR